MHFRSCVHNKPGRIRKSSANKKVIPFQDGVNVLTLINDQNLRRKDPENIIIRISKNWSGKNTDRSQGNAFDDPSRAFNSPYRYGLRRDRDVDVFFCHDIERKTIYALFGFTASYAFCRLHFSLPVSGKYNSGVVQTSSENKREIIS